jgi:hypothetical protein
MEMQIEQIDEIREAIKSCKRYVLLKRAGTSDYTRGRTLCAHILVTDGGYIATKFTVFDVAGGWDLIPKTYKTLKGLLRTAKRLNCTITIE